MPDTVTAQAGELFAACAEQHLQAVLTETGAFHVTLETQLTAGMHEAKTLFAV